MLQDVYDGEKWAAVISSDPQVSPGGRLGRNLALGFCTDGVNPFKRKKYSMWPMAVSCQNLPAHMRMTVPALWVPCIVPGFGRGSEPDDFSCFIEIIADELNHLYLNGVEVQDSTWRCVARRNECLSVFC